MQMNPFLLKTKFILWRAEKKNSVFNGNTRITSYETRQLLCYEQSREEKKKGVDLISSRPYLDTLIFFHSCDEKKYFIIGPSPR